MTNTHGKNADRRDPARHLARVESPDLSLELHPTVAHPLNAPMVRVERREAANGSSTMQVPQLDASDFYGVDGYLGFMARLEHDYPAWFDDFTRADAGMFNVSEMTEVMLQAPHPFLKGMAYGKLLDRLTPPNMARFEHN